MLSIMLQDARDNYCSYGPVTADSQEPQDGILLTLFSPQSPSEPLNTKHEVGLLHCAVNIRGAEF